MRFNSLLLLLGTALANPLAQLQERQAPAPQVCAAQVGKCQATRSLQARASTWCASLGYGTAVRTARATSTAQRTIVTTTTLFTSTTTSVAPVRTSTITSARTTTITTQATRRLTSTTTTITLFLTGTFDSCPQYTLTPIDTGVLDPDTTTSTDSQTSDAPSTTSDAPSTTGATSDASADTTTTAATTTTTHASATASQASGNQKRQVKRPLVKPSCLTATNAAQTTAACNCIIPATTTTRTTTLRATVTATRTIVNTQRLVSTVTSSPVTTITTGALRTRTVTSTITSINRVAATVTTTIEWELAATPTAFYLLDRIMAPDAAVAQWISNSDNDSYPDIQYSSARDNATVFGFNEWNELHIAGWGDNSDYPVVGLEQENQSVIMAAMQGDDDGSPVASCSIQVTSDGLCPVRCSVGDYSVNDQSGDAHLWTLDADGVDTFTNYAYSAEDGWEVEAQILASKQQKM